MKFRLAFALVALTLLINHSASAQTAPLHYRMQPYALDSGLQSSRAGEAATRIAFSSVVKVPGSPWLRLSFSGVSLGRASYLTVTSLADGAQQRLDARALAQWKNSSAYFNGDAVRVDLHLASGDSNVFARMSEVMIGDSDSVESQCDATDDRVVSTDGRAGRLLNIGCTAWLIADGRFVTAGHCTSSAGLLNTVEFNVPPSLPNGTIQHPGPEDQYVADTSTRVFVDGGIGNDWGVFETFPNSQTGLTALQAQGAFFNVTQDLGPATIRITGYGIDDGTANQTEQTNIGPNAGSSGTTMRYRVDTEGGNSGSPVIDEATGNAVGIHTNAGCFNGGGSNSGTSNFNAALWAEIGNSGGGDIDLSARARRQGTRRMAINVRRSYHGPLRFWTLPVATGWMMAGLCFAGFAFAWWARIHLGRLWSAFVTLKSDHRIVDTGPYGIVRHPIYTGIILATAALAIVKGTVYAATGALLVILGFWIKARLEEGFLREQLGTETYDDYCRRVPMLIPFAPM